MTSIEDENYIYYLVGQNLKKQRKLKHLTVIKFAQKKSIFPCNRNLF